MGTVVSTLSRRTTKCWSPVSAGRATLSVTSPESGSRSSRSPTFLSTPSSPARRRGQGRKVVNHTLLTPYLSLSPTTLKILQFYEKKKICTIKKKKKKKKKS